MTTPPAKVALVTGAPGFLGSHIVRQLVEAGTRVRAMALPDEPLDELEGLDVELVRGNVLSPDDARRAVEGVDTVFHAAAIYETFFGPVGNEPGTGPGPMYAVNLRGTFNVLEACRRQGVDKVVYTASIVAIGRPAPSKTADEDTLYADWDIDFAYGRSKHLSMWTALDFAAWGLDVRVVCPGLVIGPGDRRPTPSGRLILGIAQGKAPGYTDGGASYVDVRDAAAGHLAAATAGQAGRVYLVTAHNLTNRELIATVARVAGRSLRPRRIPTTIARLYVNAMAKRAARRNKRPDIAPIFFEYGLRECFYDNTRAVEELGMQFRPFETSVTDALDDFRGRGWL
jgi:dihydroflavonol-4-reductase